MFGRLSATTFETFARNPKLKFPINRSKSSCGRILRNTTSKNATACSENPSQNKRSKSGVLLNAQTSPLSDHPVISCTVSCTVRLPGDLSGYGCS